MYAVREVLDEWVGAVLFHCGPHIRNILFCLDPHFRPAINSSQITHVVARTSNGCFIQMQQVTESISMMLQITLSTPVFSKDTCYHVDKELGVLLTSTVHGALLNS